MAARIDFEDLLDEEEHHEDRDRLKLRLVKFASPLHLEAAVYALRMIEQERWHSRLIQRDRFRDDDILTLLGLESDDSCGSTITLMSFRALAARRLAALERRLPKCEDPLARNLRKLGQTLKLNVTELAILRLGVVATRVEHFGDLMRIAVSSSTDFIRSVRAATGHSTLRIRMALASNRALRRSGFFASEEFGANPLSVESTVVDALVMPGFDGEQFLRRLVRQAPPATLTMADFEHVPDLALVSRYLAKAMKKRPKGVNVLIYGSAGTGKTQFVRALGAHMGVTLYEVPNEDKDGDPISGQRRFSAYAICQRLLASLRDQLLLFDEVEDVFGTGESMFSPLMPTACAKNPDTLRKSWINELLETNPVPTVWVCNTIGAMDRAFLRRFDLVVECGIPSRSVRRRMVDLYFRPGDISLPCADRIAAIEQLPPAQIERASRVVRTLATPRIAERDSEAERIVCSSLRALGHRKPIPDSGLPEHYDPAFLNTDRDLATLANGLRNAAGARLCLFGPPGTGKTAFAHHLGGTLDLPIMVKRGSDLISKWVGETEELIADAFRKAHESGSILVIDEADGFLRDRGSAQRSWEVTQVNELLTQMESFNGLFIASTNLVETLDAACLRRFDFKIRFDFLTREQRRAMLRRVSNGLGASEAELEPAIAAMDRIDHVTPGDFANVLRQLRVTGERPTAQRVMDLIKAEVSMKPGASRRAIGFVS